LCRWWVASMADEQQVAEPGVTDQPVAVDGAVVDEEEPAAEQPAAAEPAALVRPPLAELALMSHSSLEDTLSDRILTLLNRATEDVAEPPSLDTLQSLSNLPEQHADAALDWMRRRIFQTESLVVRHKTLVTLRVMCENSSAVLEALKASDAARLDIEGQRNFDVPGDASLARPVELVRAEAEAILALAVEREDLLKKTKSRGQQAARAGLELLQSPRRSSPLSPFKKGGAGGDTAFGADEAVRERSLSPVARVNKDAALAAATTVGGAIATSGKMAVTMTKDSASFTKAAAQQVRQDAEKAKADREGMKDPSSRDLDDAPVDMDALFALADAELDGKLSDKLLTLLNRCTADEPKPPPQDALRGLSDTVSRQPAEARAAIVEWLRRRSLTPSNALVTHKSLITLRVLLENAGPAVKPKLTENGLILADIEGLAQYDEADPAACDKPAEMVRDAAVALLRLAQKPDQSDLEATATKAKAGASKFGRFGMRKSKAALEKANEKATGLRASMSAAAAAGVGGGGSPRARAGMPEEREKSPAAQQESIGTDGASEALADGTVSMATTPDSLTPSAEEGIPTESPGVQSMPGSGTGGGEVATPEPA
jgi:hypothetical protein